MSGESIHTVAVLGLGTMGHGIAQMLAMAGCQVHCYDSSPAARDTLVDRIQANLRQMADAGMVGKETIGPNVERLSVCDNEAEAVAPARFVTEAISEDLDLKQETLARVEDTVAADTILASNSSSFPISASGVRLRRPERALVTHWFNPAHLVPLVEVVPGKQTSEATIETTLELLRRMGKLPVRLHQEIPGFLVNRIQVAMYREVWDLLGRGVASAEDIDRAVQSSIGLRLAALGPLQVCDFAGLDVWSSVYENLVQDIRADTGLPEALGALVGQGHLGTKTGKGVYEYTSESVEEQREQRDRRLLALAKLLWGEEI